MSDDHDHSNCGHDHSKDHDHSQEQEQKPAPGMMFANAMVNMANEAMQNNVPALELANGMRHAAANFSAFAFFQPENKNDDPNFVMEEFQNFFEYYLDRHKPAAPAPGLQDIIAKAKSEF